MAKTQMVASLQHKQISELGGQCDQVAIVFESIWPSTTILDSKTFLPQ